MKFLKEFEKISLNFFKNLGHFPIEIGHSPLKTIQTFLK